MSTQEGIIDGIAKRYAKALFDLSVESSKTEKTTIRRDVAKLTKILKTSDSFSQLVRSPVLSADVQDKAIQAVLARAKIGTIVAQFVGLVCQNRRAYALASIMTGFAALEAKERGEITAEIISVSKLNAVQEKAVKTQLKKKFGKDVRIDATIDPAMLGGLIVKVGSQMIDGSLRTKLNSLKQAMYEAG